MVLDALKEPYVFKFPLTTIFPPLFWTPFMEFLAPRADGGIIKDKVYFFEVVQHLYLPVGCKMFI